MNKRMSLLGLGALLAASSAAYADGHIQVDINPFGWGAPPPVVYESPRYYAPPPVVYYGQGRWGDQRDRGRREHDRGRGRGDHHDEGDRRH